MSKYRIRISSFADVEADSPEDALDVDVGSQFDDNQQVLGVEEISVRSEPLRSLDLVANTQVFNIETLNPLSLVPLVNPQEKAKLYNNDPDELQKLLDKVNGDQ